MRLIADFLLEMRQPGQPRLNVPLRALASEAMIGAVASLVTLAHCLSFSALIFSGPLAVGLSGGLWGFLFATAVGTLVLAFTSTIPPVLAGPRNPAVAVMSVLAASIATTIMTAGGDGARAAQVVLIALSLAAGLTGLVLWLLGTFRLGQIVRFVPYPVIGGFLGASGILLITGGFTILTGKSFGLTTLAGLSLADWARIAIAMAFVGIVLLLRRNGAGSVALPALFVSTALALDLALWWFGARQGWYLGQATAAAPWSPLSALSRAAADWTVIASAGIEILSIVAVAIIALLLDVSSLEVQRRTSADMDREFRANGALNLALAPFGAFPTGVALNPSRLVDELGGSSRAASLGGGLLLALILVTGFDVAAYVPTPLLAGLVIYLGIGVLSEALLQSPARRSLPELGLALAIMLAIVRFGYLTGVVLGLVGACITFAVRYSRIDAIRRHVTRADFQAPVERAPEIRALLHREGGRIHLFWLTGFIFFGSSNRIYEDIRAKVGPAGARAKCWVILDVSGVAGIDTSALLAFEKLRNWAESNDVVLTIAGSTHEHDIGAAATDDTIAPNTDTDSAVAMPAPRASTVRTFPDRTEALEWCEEALIRETHPAALEAGVDGFRHWLALELGAEHSQRLMDRYLARREIAAGGALCRQGEAADQIDLVASGSLAITFVDATGREIRVRRMTGQTVIGEMGFFRSAARAASVIAAGDAVVYTMTRERYEALTREDPALGRVFLEFVVRALADRVDFANREIAVLI